MNPQKGEVPPAEREAFTKARPEPYRTMKRIAAREDARAALDSGFDLPDPDKEELDNLLHMVNQEFPDMIWLFRRAIAYGRANPATP